MPRRGPPPPHRPTTSESDESGESMMAFLSGAPVISSATTTPQQKFQQAFPSIDQYLAPPKEWRSGTPTTKSRLRPKMLTMAGNIGMRVVKGVLGSKPPQSPTWTSDVYARGGVSNLNVNIPNTPDSTLASSTASQPTSLTAASLTLGRGKRAKPSKPQDEAWIAYTLSLGNPPSQRSSVSLPEHAEHSYFHTTHPQSPPISRTVSYASVSSTRSYRLPIPIPLADDPEPSTLRKRGSLINLTEPSGSTMFDSMPDSVDWGADRSIYGRDHTTASMTTISRPTSSRRSISPSLSEFRSDARGVSPRPSTGGTISLGVVEEERSSVEGEGRKSVATQRGEKEKEQAEVKEVVQEQEPAQEPSKETSPSDESRAPTACSFLSTRTSSDSDDKEREDQPTPPENRSTKSKGKSPASPSSLPVMPPPPIPARSRERPFSPQVESTPPPPLMVSSRPRTIPVATYDSDTDAAPVEAPARHRKKKSVGSIKRSDPGHSSVKSNASSRSMQLASTASPSSRNLADADTDTAASIDIKSWRKARKRAGSAPKASAGASVPEVPLPPSPGPNVVLGSMTRKSRPLPIVPPGNSSVHGTALTSAASFMTDNSLSSSQRYYTHALGLGFSPTPSGSSTTPATSPLPMATTPKSAMSGPPPYAYGAVSPLDPAFPSHAIPTSPMNSAFGLAPPPMPTPNLGALWARQQQLQQLQAMGLGALQGPVGGDGGLMQQQQQQLQQTLELVLTLADLNLRMTHEQLARFNPGAGASS